MLRSEECDLRARKAPDSSHLHSCQERRWHSEVAVCSEFSSVTGQWCPGAVLYKVLCGRYFALGHSEGAV